MKARQPACEVVNLNQMARWIPHQETRCSTSAASILQSKSQGSVMEFLRLRSDWPLIQHMALTRFLAC